MIRAGRARCRRRSHQAQALTSRRSSARMAVLAMPSARRPAIHCSMSSPSESPGNSMMRGWAGGMNDCRMAVTVAA